MKLGSEGVYLHETCGTNAFRHLPGLKTAIKNKKNVDFRDLGGFGRKSYIYMNSRSTALGGPDFNDNNSPTRLALGFLQLG